MDISQNSRYRIPNRDQHSTLTIPIGSLRSLGLPNFDVWTDMGMWFTVIRRSPLGESWDIGCRLLGSHRGILKTGMVLWIQSLLSPKP